MLLISAVLAAALSVVGSAALFADPGGIEIRSDSECPSAAVVRAQLLSLMPDASGVVATISRQGRDTASDREEEVLELRLSIDQQSSTLRRRLPAHRSCEQAARLTATVIATWIAMGAGAPERAPETTPAASATAPRREPRVAIDVGGALTASLADLQLTIAEQLELRLGFSARRYGLRMGLRLGSSRALPLGTQQVEWTRWAFLLQPGVELSRGPWFFDAAAGGSLALVMAAGQGFSHSRKSFAIDCGLGGALRVGRRFAPASAFLSVELVNWLVPQQVGATEQGLPEKTYLPQLELLFSIGVTVENLGARRPL